MKERPILFSAPMVRAILSGSKSQTRRVVKPQPEVSEQGNLSGKWLSRPISGLLLPKLRDITIHCPYGMPGDRLWVRETWMDTHGTGVEHRDEKGNLQRYAYAANTRPGSYGDECRKDFGLKWRPSIHMPRAASRILLEVTAVRVERLQDISEDDARAEGVDALPIETRHATPKTDFQFLWESINGPGSWAANPWVWVIEFKRVMP